MAENNGDTPGQRFMQIEIPEYAFTINPDEEGKPLWIGLDIKGSSYHMETFLSLPQPGEIEKIARSFNQQLLRVSTTLKRSAKGLIVAKGVDSRALRTEGRE